MELESEWNRNGIEPLWNWNRSIPALFRFRSKNPAQKPKAGMKGPGASAVFLGKGANGAITVYPLSNSCPHLSLWLFRSKDVKNVNRSKGLHLC